MLYAIVAVIALIIDQAVKYWTTVNIVVDTGEAKFIPGFIHLANVHNTGAAFSFLQGARWFFVILCIIFVLIVIYALAKDIIKNKLSRWMAIFVMAGAIGNCIDRIVCGYVVDMFEFDFLLFKHRFPVFNVADIYITIGVVVFCICILLEKPKKPKTQKESVLSSSKDSTISDAGSMNEKKQPVRPRRHTLENTPPIAHSHQPDPTVNSFDPFAEWEAKTSQPEMTTSPNISFSDSTSSVEVPEQTEPESVPVSTNQNVIPDTTTKEDLPTAKNDNVESFNLDDILAEFRDI